MLAGPGLQQLRRPPPPHAANISLPPVIPEALLRLAAKRLSRPPFLTPSSLRLLLPPQILYFPLSPTKGCQAGKLLATAKKGQDITITSKQILLFKKEREKRRQIKCECWWFTQVRKTREPRPSATRKESLQLTEGKAGWGWRQLGAVQAVLTHLHEATRKRQPWARVPPNRAAPAGTQPSALQFSAGPAGGE